MNHPDLLALAGQPEGCSCLFGRCGGFSKSLEHQDWFHNLPEKLARKGINNEEWQQWMSALSQVQGHQGDCDFMRTIHCLLCYPWVLPNPIFCLCNCLVPWSKCDPFQVKLHEWMQEVNEVLEPKGMYVKGMCFAETGKGGDHWKDGTLALLVFALTEKQSSRLKCMDPLQQGLSGNPNWGFWCCLSHKDRAI